jgi:hypothetical protein
VRKLREADRLLSDGQDVPEVAKQLEVSEANRRIGQATIRSGGRC